MHRGDPRSTLFLGLTRKESFLGRFPRQITTPKERAALFTKWVTNNSCQVEGSVSNWKYGIKASKFTEISFTIHKGESLHSLIIFEVMCSLAFLTSAIGVPQCTKSTQRNHEIFQKTSPACHQTY